MSRGWESLQDGTWEGSCADSSKLVVHVALPEPVTVEEIEGDGYLETLETRERLVCIVRGENRDSWCTPFMER